VAWGPLCDRFGVCLAGVAPVPCFLGWAVFCAGCIWLAWHFYARKGAEKPS